MYNTITAFFAGLFLGLPIMMSFFAMSNLRNCARPNPPRANAAVVPRTSTTTSNQHRDDINQTRLNLDLMLRQLIKLSLWSIFPSLAYVAKDFIPHDVILDNINVLLLLSTAFWVLCDCLARGEESSHRNENNFATAVDTKVEQNFLSKARELREKAPNDIAAPEVFQNSTREFIASARAFSEKMGVTLGEKMHQLAEVADGSTKNHSTKPAILNPEVFAEAIEIILRKDAHAWREIESALAGYLKDVMKGEHEWEWI